MPVVPTQEVLDERTRQLRSDFEHQITCNDETHKDLYNKLDCLKNRLPTFAVILINVLVGLLAVATTMLAMGGH